MDLRIPVQPEWIEPRSIGIPLLVLSSTASFAGACSGGWSVSGAFTEFGSRDGIDALYDVRGAVRFPDGRIAVANHGRLSRGDFVFSMNQPLPGDGARADTSSVTPSGGMIYFSGPDGRMSDSISGLRGDDRATAVSAPSAGRLRIRTIPVPFLKTIEASASGDRVAVGSTNRYEFRLYAQDGRLIRIIRAPHTPRSADASIIDTWIAAQVDHIDDPSERESRTRSLGALVTERFASRSRFDRRRLERTMCWVSSKTRWVSSSSDSTL